MAGTNGTTIAGRFNRILLVIAICFLVVAAIALACIAALSSSMNSFIDNEYRVASTVSQIMRGNQGMGRFLSSMINAAYDNERDNIEVYYTECKDYYAQMDTGLRELVILESAAVDHEGVEAGIASASTIPATIEEIHQLCIQGQAAQAWEVYKTDYSPIVTSIRETITKVLDVSNASAEDRIHDKDVLTAATFIIAILAAIASLVVLFMLTRRLINRITKPIGDLEQASGRMTRGKLDTHIEYDGDDELGSLCNNFNESCETLSSYVAEIATFADAINRGKLNFKSQVQFVGDFKPIGDSLEQLSISLSDDMAKIGASAEQVYSGAEQMSSVGTQLSQSAVEQASSVQELATTINTVSDHVTTNAATALEVRDSANALYSSMESFAQLMKEVNQGLIDTRDMTDQVRGIVRNLETISFQTNTLALNAAVEAARAGDAGRGFAIIAEEVRELATEASRATTNTSFLLNDVISKVSHSADRSVRAINSLSSILADGNTTAVNVEKISNASKDQAVALEQVRSSISGLSASIQGLTTMAEESAASAEELQSQMKLLNQMVDSFEIRR